MSVRSACGVIAIAALALAPALTAAQSIPERPSDESAATVRSLENRLESALATADASFLESVIGDDFRFASADGVTFSKADWIRAFARPGRFIARTLTSVHVEPHGDVALTRGRIEVKTSEPSQYTVCYIRLYAQRNGRWQLISHHTFREAMGSFAETCAPK